MTDTITRDEFETVKELLARAARYAESANRRIDELTVKQDRTQQQLDELGTTQKATEQSLQTLVKAQAATEQRLESFIFHSQRLISQNAEAIAQLKAGNDSLRAIVAYLMRKEGYQEGGGNGQPQA